MRSAVLMLLCLTAVAVHSSSADVLAKKKKKKHQHHSTTSTSTSTTTTTTTTEVPPPTDTTGDDNAGDILYLDNMDIIKIHLPLPVHHDDDVTANYTTATAPTISQDTPASPLPTATPPAHLPTAPSFTDSHSALPTATAPAHLPTAPSFTDGPGRTTDASEDSDTPDDVDDDAEDAADLTTAVPTQDKVVVPDVATFDVVFSNRSRLGSDVRSFTFGGVFEIVVNRTGSSVEVTMIRHTPAEPADTISDSKEEVETNGEKTSRGLQMMVRGPAITGLQQQQDNEKQDEGNDATERDNTSEKSTQDIGDKGTQDEQKDTSVDADVSNSDDDDTELDKSRDSRHSADQAADSFDAVFINGSALGGVDLGVVSFNTSGTFKLNMSVSEDFMTVIISQVSQQMQKHGVNMPAKLSGFAWHSGPERQRSVAPAGGAAVGSPLAAVALVAAVACLLGAVVVWRARRRARVNTFLRRGEDYGSVESADEAVNFDYHSK